MGSFALLVAVLVWQASGPGFEASARTEARLAASSDGSSLRTESARRRAVKVRVSPRAAGPCDDGMDRCNRAPGFVTPGVQYVNLEPGTW